MHARTNKYSSAETHGLAVAGESPFPRYPVDLSTYLALSPDAFDEAGIACNKRQHHPATIAHVALAHWNQYLTDREERAYQVFLAQARWFVAHEEHSGGGGGIWPITQPYPGIDGSRMWLSATAQGGALSVLLRAYRLTGEDTFFATAQRAQRSFERDILDGGVQAPVGEAGAFFEEISVYPAAHHLIGFFFALLGLYDYVWLTGDASVEQLIQRSQATLHDLLNEFDTGYWVLTDLLHRRLATPEQMVLQTQLLGILAAHEECEQCKTRASRWKEYQQKRASRLRYLFSNQCALLNRAFWVRVRTVLFPAPQPSQHLHACVTATGFPVMGGTRAVLANVAQVTANVWDIEYVTRQVGPDREGLTIHVFGTALMTPRHFPTVWLYFLAGLCKLIWLLRQGMNYDVILPQDGVFTAAFSALAGKLAGRRVVCIDHGNLTLLKNDAYRNERISALAHRSRPFRLIARLFFGGYWPSLYVLAWLAARYVDHFLVPGVTGDGVEEICQKLGISSSRLTRFASMIDVDRYPVHKAEARAQIRHEKGIPADAIVVTLVCRLSPEKGLDIALESISRALTGLPATARRRVRVIIAGDGPERARLEEDIRTRGLSEICILWGATPAERVSSLLSISDIFLYTSRRGACLSMAVLEAMASGCAVIASTRPLSNATMLAEGRGIAVPAEDVEETTRALERLLNDVPLCHRMGRLAREYVTVWHSATRFRRLLLRATRWAALDELLLDGTQEQADLGAP